MTIDFALMASVPMQRNGMGRSSKFVTVEYGKVTRSINKPTSCPLLNPLGPLKPFA